MILVIGEALIDLIESRETKGQFQAVVGGANANVALALARRGANHQFLARISSDRFGILIKDRLSSNNVNLDHIINTWIKDSNKIVLLTRGSQGTRIYRNNQTIDVPARKITVVDTVGAGDTFVANLLGQLNDNNYLGKNALDKLETLTSEDLAEYVRISGIAASIACERAGCEPPTLEEVKALS